MNFFIDRGVKAVVVACNTATGIAVDELRRTFPAVPIVAIEPALKPAALSTRSGVVGILATSGTLASEKFRRLVDAHGRDVRVLARAGSGLVEQVERGDYASDTTRALVEQHVRPMVEAGADIVVLGCTHFPFLTSLIQAVAGPGVTVIDPAVAVARELRRRLAPDALAPSSHTGRESFHSTGSVADVARVIGQLWNRPVDVDPLPPPYA